MDKKEKDFEKLPETEIPAFDRPVSSFLWRKIMREGK